MSEPIKVEISQSSVQSIIASHVQTAVMQALLPHKEQFVREMVEKSLLVVNEGSDYNRYRSTGKITVLEEIVRKIIVEEATAAIKEWAQSHRQEIADNIKKSISTKGYASKFALAAVESLLSSTAFRFHVNCEPILKKDL